MWECCACNIIFNCYGIIESEIKNWRCTVCWSQLIATKWRLRNNKNVLDYTAFEIQLSIWLKMYARFVRQIFLFACLSTSVNALRKKKKQSKVQAKMHCEKSSTKINDAHCFYWIYLCLKTKKWVHSTFCWNIIH